MLFHFFSNLMIFPKQFRLFLYVIRLVRHVFKKNELDLGVMTSSGRKMTLM